MPEVVGYVYDNAIYCPSCCPVDPESPDVSPVFDSSEWDYIPTCDECSSPLDVSFTWDGLLWAASEVGVLPELGDESSPLEIDKELLRQFLQSFLHVGLRWIEACIDRGLLAEPDFNLNEFYQSVVRARK